MMEGIETIQDSGVKTISDLATRQLTLETTIAFKEEELAQLKKELEQVSTIDLPEAMEEFNISDLTLTNGARLSINNELRAWIKKENKEEVFQWLRDNNEGSIIKTKIQAEFDRGDDRKVLEAYRFLIGAGIKTEKTQDIHWQTLCAFTRNMLADGKPLHDKIDIQSVKRAKIKFNL